MLFLIPCSNIKLVKEIMKGMKQWIFSVVTQLCLLWIMAQFWEGCNIIETSVSNKSLKINWWRIKNSNQHIQSCFISIVWSIIVIISSFFQLIWILWCKSFCIKLKVLSFKRCFYYFSITSIGLMISFEKSSLFRIIKLMA